MFNVYQGTQFVVWIRVTKDPHTNFRGFPILGRELRVVGYEPVDDEMQDFRGERMRGRFWVVEENEVHRAIPELRKVKTGKAWFFPFEFCDSFIRPFDYLDFPVKEVFIWEEHDNDPE